MSIPERLSANPATGNLPNVDEFVSLFTRHAPWLRGYVMSLVSNHADAEDVLQNTNSVLWKRFSQFQPGTDFFAWACQIARNEVMHYRRSQKREVGRFSDDFVDLISSEAISLADDLDHIRTVLAHCLSKLSDAERRLVEERYREESTIDSVAAVVGRSVAACYKSLARIRKTLLVCVQRNWEAKSLR